ncbi:MAG: zinc-ribbon domain-containing protein [Salinigranum sp.]
MRACPECGAEWPDDVTVCTRCGTEIEHSEPSSDHAAADTTGAPLVDADYSQQTERERFEQRYAIDIGQRTVDEFLEHLARQDYSPTAWFWAVVVTELAGIGLFVYSHFAFDGWRHIPIFVAFSALLALSIYADTREVGQFRRWSKTRWTYILVSVLPFVGQIGGFLYLVLRRLMRQQAVEHRRRLMEAGFDLDFDPQEY